MWGPAGGGAGLPGSLDPHGSPDPPLGARGRHPPLPHRRGRDRAGAPPPPHPPTHTNTRARAHTHTMRTQTHTHTHTHTHTQTHKYTDTNTNTHTRYIHSTFKNESLSMHYKMFLPFVTAARVWQFGVLAKLHHLVTCPCLGQSARRPKPYTPHSQLCTMNPAPCSLDPAP